MPLRLLLAVTLASLVGSGCQAQEADAPVAPAAQSSQQPPQAGQSALNPAETVKAMLNAYLSQ